MVHHKSGKPSRFWERVGGKLFLTSEALEFRTHPMDWYAYRIRIPVREIECATPCKIGSLSRGLRVERKDGSFELFAFGAIFDRSSEWVDAIIRVRQG
jgi:hypothetical protein